MTLLSVEGLSKLYRIGGNREEYKTLRDTFTDLLVSSFHRAGKLFRGGGVGAAEHEETFWALKDVSFEIKRGEVVGIIGRNGAGKSTLLKILSRITEPTEIVAFAEIQRFIDTPVKHYSSGMYLRLAFAVAAHLEPEILLVDEVLAVGDARFQKKCLNKMQDIGQQGRTILFVSHNLAAITRLCERVILLDEGRILRDGRPAQVVGAYLNPGVGTTAARVWPDPTQAPGGEIARLCAVRVRTEDGRITDTVDIRQPVGIEMEYEVLKPGYVLLPNYDIYNEEGVHIIETVDLDPAWRRRPRPAGRWVSTAWIPGNLLSEGALFVSASIITMDPVIIQFGERDVVVFQVIDSLDGDSARGDWAGRLTSVVRPLCQWTTQCSPNGREAATMITGEGQL